MTLEQELAQWQGADWTAAVCSSGTAALHLALEALHLPLGSRVAVPDFTMIACARAVTLAGHVPVFVGADERMLMDPQGLRDALRKYGCRAVMPVHVYGRRCQQELLGIATEQEAYVVDDAAEAHGVQPLGIVVCYSFYRNKIIHGEEGGAVLSRSHRLADAVRELRSFANDRPMEYVHKPRGCSYRLSDSNAQLIRTSLLNYKYNRAVRRTQMESFDAACPPEWKLPAREAHWVYDIRIPSIANRRECLQMMDGVMRAGFVPLSQQPEYSGCSRTGPECDFASEVLYFNLLHPSAPSTLMEQLKRIVVLAGK